MKSFPVRSNSINDRPQFVVMVGNDPYSVHVTKYDAAHNARVVGGIVQPIDWVGDELILPIRS